MTESESKQQPALLAVSKTETGAQSHSPNPSVAFTLQASAPATPSVQLTSAIRTCQPSDNLIPPVEAISRWPESLVVSKIETNTISPSPIASVALTPLAHLPAFLSQVNSISQPSLGLDWLLLKPPNGVGFKRCLYDAVSVSFISSVTLRSPEFEMGFNPISQPGHLWADSTSHPSSLELVWWECIKPPNMAACQRFLREAIKMLSRQTGLATHCSWPTLRRHPWSPILLVSVIFCSHRRLWTWSVTLSSFASCCLWTA